MQPFDFQIEIPERLRHIPLFENSPLDLLIGFGVMAALFIVLLLARRLVRRQHKKMLATVPLEVLEVPFEILSRTSAFLFLLLSFAAGFWTLKMASDTRRIVALLLTVTFIVQAGIWASAGMFAWLDRRRRRIASIEDRAVVGSLGIIGMIGRMLIWSLVGLLVLAHVGINISALLAGLGIGGIAIALAAQNILGDLFASLTITLEKPFLVGDFLVLDTFSGTVERIGIKSTRMRSVNGEQIILPNADILKSRVRNYGGMQERRIVMVHNVTYDTPLDKLEQIPGIVRTAIEHQKGTRFDRSHFAKHGATSLDFESAYFVLSAEYGVYMDVQQAINFEIHRRFAELQIEFAFPTQRLYFSHVHGPEAPQKPD